MSSVRPTPAQRRLRAARVPGEAHTEERAWQVVRTAYAERPQMARRGLRPRLALVPLAAAIAGILSLTPAGAAVHRWIDQTLGVRHARLALFSLPARGALLVAGPGGTWTVGEDGARRRLGSWQDATWSPRALYVAVAGRDQLSALNPRGTPQWSIARPAVRFPRWFAPDGYRVAYLSGATLRVIAGDGTGDHRLARDVSAVAPAWQPGHRYSLAYITRGGSVVVRDADSGAVAWQRRVVPAPRRLTWSADGALLLVLGAARAAVLTPDGRRVAQIPAQPGLPLLDGAFSPDGRRLVLLSARQVALYDLSRPDQPGRVLFSGSGLRELAWSPDGAWLLLSWPAADQWVFIHATGRPRIAAVSRIAQQFGGRSFPTLEGWCCTSPVPAG